MRRLAGPFLPLLLLVPATALLDTRRHDPYADLYRRLARTKATVRTPGRNVDPLAEVRKRLAKDATQAVGSHEALDPLADVRHRLAVAAGRDAGRWEPPVPNAGMTFISQQLNEQREERARKHSKYRNLSCERNGTKYRVFRFKNYSSVPCDVPCWSTHCIEIGGACEDPSGFMCSELEFKNVSYGDAAEPVFVDGSRRSIDFPWQQIPSLYTNMEAIFPAHDPELSATTSLRSAVPVQYLEFTGPLQTPSVDFDRAIKGASMMISQCAPTIMPLPLGAPVTRLTLARKLMHHIPVDSFGKCEQNKELPVDARRGPKSKTKWLQKAFIAQKYLFHFAFENYIQEDYVTEKMWEMLRAGTLPVYLGAPNIQELLPMKAFVNVADFQTPDDLGHYLNYLAGNKSAYMEYHKWRSEPLPASFKQKWGFARVHSVCRACRWAYARREMLTWNSAQQRVGPAADGSHLVLAVHRRRRSLTRDS